MVQALRALTYFNPRSRKGSDVTELTGFCPSLNFNPRSRKGSDEIHMLRMDMLHGISIHAPARGATVMLFTHKFGVMISIHAPARGATPLFERHVVTNNDFNPRSRKGSDYISNTYTVQQFYFNPRSRKGSDKRGAETPLADVISIHAPARGATIIILRIILFQQFQSTLPQGERHFVLVP